MALLRAEFQEAMDCAWILGSPRRLLLACSYHTGNAGCERRQHVERWGFGGLLIPFHNEVSGPEAISRGQLHPLATLIPLSSPACQACSNKTTHNRSFEYPTYRCSFYCVEITILYSSRFCCFCSWSLTAQHVMLLLREFHLLKQQWQWVLGNVFQHVHNTPFLLS